MKRIPLVFSILAMLIFASFPVMELAINTAETAGYCNNCFLSFLKKITMPFIFTTLVISSIGAILGYTVGYITYKLLNNIKK